MEDKTSEDERMYTNETYVVLSDGSTYDGIDGSAICFVTEIGSEQLRVNNDMKFVDDNEVATISLHDLMDAYNQVHGTNI